MSTKDLQQLIEYVNSPNYNDSMLVSTDYSVASVEQIEIIPREQSSFGYQSAAGVVSSDTLSDRLTFYVSDPRRDIDWANSYFTCEFKARAVTAGNAGLNAFLDEGGIHAAIKTVIIKMGSVELHRIENYNKKYNIWNLSSHDPDYRNIVLGSGGDSIEDVKDVVVNPAEGKALTYTVAGSDYDSATGVLTLVAGDLLNNISIGDELILNGLYSVKVIRINSATVAVVSFGAGDIADGALLSVTKMSHFSTRKRLVSSLAAASIPSNKLSWHLPLGFLQMSQYFPLRYLTAPLEITFEFVEPSLALVLPSGAAADNQLGYLVGRPRLVASMVEPTAEVVEMRDRMYMADGLMYKFIDYRNFQTQIPSGNSLFNFTIQTNNINSAQNVFVVLTSQSNNSASNTASQTTKCQSTFNKYNLEYFRFRAGGIQMPSYGNVICNELTGAEPFKQLQLALNHEKNTVLNGSIRPWEWAKSDSNKFIIAMNLAKESGVYNTGLSLVNNYLELELKFTANLPEAVAVQIFVGYDCVVQLSKERGMLKYY